MDPELWSLKKKSLFSMIFGSPQRYVTCLTNKSAFQESYLHCRTCWSLVYFCRVFWHQGVQCSFLCWLLALVTLENNSGWENVLSSRGNNVLFISPIFISWFLLKKNSSSKSLLPPCKPSYLRRWSEVLEVEWTQQKLSTHTQKHTEIDIEASLIFSTCLEL